MVAFSCSYSLHIHVFTGPGIACEYHMFFIQIHLLFDQAYKNSFSYTCPWFPMYLHISSCVFICPAIFSICPCVFSYLHISLYGHISSAIFIYLSMFLSTFICSYPTSLPMLLLFFITSLLIANRLDI